MILYIILHPLLKYQRNYQPSKSYLCENFDDSFVVVVFNTTIDGIFFVCRLYLIKKKTERLKSNGFLIVVGKVG